MKQVAPVRRLALIGLAKNTGKTQTLTSILGELTNVGMCVGVTSIGRDGEAHDAIDARIDKPRIHLRRGGLVASTDALLRASGVAHERLVRTSVRTPLGEVVVARMTQDGTVEVAGPSTAPGVRRVSDSMIAMGAERVLIDGSIDRRAASAPAVAGGVVVATGAVLGHTVREVAAATRDAVEVVRLPVADPRGSSAPVTVPRQIALGADPDRIAGLLSEHARASTLLVDGALGERLLLGLVAARRERDGRELRVVARDPTRVFLNEHGPSWYERQGVRIEVLKTIDLRAITVNPVAPRSHTLDSRELCQAIARAVPGVPVLDVLDPD